LVAFEKKSHIGRIYCKLIFKSTEVVKVFLVATEYLEILRPSLSLVVGSGHSASLYQLLEVSLRVVSRTQR
jgi:hypothetical protein